ncbi:RRQRL motif-containing zinc-binding protein [Nonomuraea sp. NPDC023979]|uniref:RRQRL motif-containing zinc-binding protein n=1 Tax=Nonomuraea sp. NPDC023979 TaxID=3154796 RepID=UPI0033F0D23F
MSRARMPYYDPEGKKWGFPTYPWEMAPEGMATYRQLRKLGLRPNGQGVQAQIMWGCKKEKAGYRVAYLYRIDLAAPIRPMTPAKRAAIAKALEARKTCSDCGTVFKYVLPTRYGACIDCDGWGVGQLPETPPTPTSERSIA